MKRWNKDEEDVIREIYPDMGAVYVATLLGRTRQAVNTKAMKLGVSVKESVKEQIAKEKGKQNLNHSKGEKNNNWNGGPETYDWKEYRKRTRDKHKEREIVRDKVRVAIKKGLIIRKPCEVCGDKKSEAHHDDYSKPYEVIFLCRKHHVVADKNRKEI